MQLTLLVMCYPQHCWYLNSWFVLKSWRSKL